MSYGLILGIGAVAVAAAALSRSAALLVAAVAAVLVALLVESARRRVFRGVTFRRTLSRPTVAWGGEVEVGTELRNGKWMPLPWLRVRDRWPRSLELPDGLAATSSFSGRVVEQVFSLRWQETVRRRHRCRCPERGLHRFGPAELVGGDPLGFTESTLELPAADRLVVLPKVLRVPDGELLLSALPGEVERRAALAVDPARLAGVRPYRRGDPLRAVNWRATARRRSLYTSEFEPSAESPVMLLLDLRTFGHVTEGLDPKLFELLIVVAASLAAELDRRGCSVGLASNGQLAGSARGLRLEPDREGLREVLTALGAVAVSPPPTFEALLAREIDSPRPADAYVVVSSRVTPVAAALLGRLERRAPVTVVHVGTADSVPARPADVNVAADFDWVDEDVLALA